MGERGVKVSLIYTSVFLFSLLCVLSSNLIQSQETVKVTAPKAKLPEKIIVGYANWNECDNKTILSAKNGVNVIIWFSIDLAFNSTTGKPCIARGPNPECVSNQVKELRDLNLETIHLISIGGWNSPHPDTTKSAQEVFAEWKRWNEEVIAKPEIGFFGYDGIDWDIEGNDNFSSSHNHFTVECLDLMGEFSQLAKRDGFIVSMAPAESYLDPTTSAFDRELTHVYPEWEPIVPNFTYRGHNTYSYLLSRYGSVDIGNQTATVKHASSFNSYTPDVDPSCPSTVTPTFDFITIQLYEGYSHALYNTSILKQPASQYIRNFVLKVEEGWQVNFTSDSEINWTSQTVQVEPNRLVIGLANAWADNSKFLLLPSKEVCFGYKNLTQLGKAVRGFAFWNMQDEGNNIPSGEQMWLADDLNRFLHIRNQTKEDLC